MRASPRPMILAAAIALFVHGALVGVVGLRITAQSDPPPSPHRVESFVAPPPPPRPTGDMVESCVWVLRERWRILGGLTTTTNAERMDTTWVRISEFRLESQRYRMR